jgi:general stress protein 26
MRDIIKIAATLLDDEFDATPRVCSLASVGPQGRATVRTMVLRQLSDTGGLLFVSDRRTKKDEHLRERPLCEVCFWLAKLNTQIRVQGEAVVVDALNDSGLREQWWNQMDERGVLIFAGQRNPPQLVPMPTTFELITITPTWIAIDNYGTTPPTHQEWGTRDD